MSSTTQETNTNLRAPYPDSELIPTANRLVGEANLLAQYRKDNDFPLENITDPETRRQASANRVQDDEGAINWLEQRGMQLNENQARKLIPNFARSLEKAQKEISQMQEVIENNPELLAKVIGHAQEESLLIQRFALGEAMRRENPDARISEVGFDNILARYQKGQLRTIPEDFKNAQRLYEAMRKQANSVLIGGDSLDNQTIALREFFDPLNQINGYETP